MILRNLYMIWGAKFMNSSQIKARNRSGTEVEVHVSNYTGRALFGDFGRTGSGFISVFFGSGTTEPTFEDYCLENDIGSSNLIDNNYLYPTHTYDRATGVCERTITFVLTNNRTTAINVSEIGIADSNILIYREVLPSNKRFTVAAGETIKYTHTIRFTVPTSSDE